MMKLFYIFILMGLNFIVTAQEEYEIKFDRDNIAGQKFNFFKKKTEKLTRVFTKEDAILKSEIKSKETLLEAYAEILVAEENEHVMKIVIKSFKETDLSNGKEIVLLTKDTDILIKTIEGAVTFYSGGKEVDKLTAKHLSIFFRSKDDNIKDDEIFGSEEKRKIGESWDIKSKDEMLRGFTKKGATFDKKTLKGKVTLQSRETLDGVDTLVVTGEVSASGLNVPDNGKFPPNTEITSSFLKSSYLVNLPIDLKLAMPKSVMTMKFGMSLKIPLKGKVITVQMLMSQTFENERTKLKSAFGL
ncbi:MAG: hypothetical protein NE334_15555 [Lentisphaeraceae bacterium]|nr:hypothetical protein [Lentisphaeraceae bacterium]